MSVFLEDRQAEDGLNQVLVVVSRLIPPFEKLTGHHLFLLSFVELALLRGDWDLAS